MQNNYTVYDDNRVNAKIQDDLDLIIRSLKSSFGKAVLAIILAGSFGRSEGGVIFQKDKAEPVNDYDIIIITNRRINNKLISDIRKKLASRLGVTWVDISVYTEQMLGHLKPSIYHYDFKYASMVLSGDKTILEKIPVMDPARLPLIEGELLFHTRLWCFLGTFKTHYMNNGVRGREKFFLMNQLSKALLAIEDIILLENGLYLPSYRERIENFRSLTETTDPALLLLIEQATEFKLKPVQNPSVDVLDLYFQVRDLYLDRMLDFLSLLYRKKKLSWEKYIRLYRLSFKNIVKMVLSYFPGKKAYSDRINNDIAQLLLIRSITRKGPDRILLKKAVVLLSKINRELHGTSDWDHAASFSADFRAGDL